MRRARWTNWVQFSIPYIKQWTYAEACVEKGSIVRQCVTLPFSMLVTASAVATTLLPSKISLFVMISSTFCFLQLGHTTTVRADLARREARQPSKIDGGEGVQLPGLRKRQWLSPMDLREAEGGRCAAELRTFAQQAWDREKEYGEPGWWPPAQEHDAHIDAVARRVGALVPYVHAAL